MAGALDLLVHPEQPLHGGAELARTGLHVLGDLAALAWMADDSPTRLKCRPVGRNVMAWGAHLHWPLGVIKAVDQSLNCSVTDALLACVSGAVGAWLMDQGDDPTGVEIRAMVPINLWPLDPAWRVSNCFGLAASAAAADRHGQPGRTAVCGARRMSQLQGNFPPVVANGVLVATGLLVKPMQGLVLVLFWKKTTAIATHVWGPRELLKLCGCTLQQRMFWVPASGNIRVGVSIRRYGSGV